VLRRTGGTTRRPIVFADLALDPATRDVRRGDRRIDLRPTEFALLEALMSDPGRVMTRAALYESVWGYDFGRDSKTLDVYIGYLRRKLEANGAARLIHTVRDVGYVMRTE
jgi:two-component system response regulator MprA